MTEAMKQGTKPKSHWKAVVLTSAVATLGTAGIFVAALHGRVNPDKPRVEPAQGTAIVAVFKECTTACDKGLKKLEMEKLDLQQQINALEKDSTLGTKVCQIAIDGLGKSFKIAVDAMAQRADEIGTLKAKNAKLQQELDKLKTARPSDGYCPCLTGIPGTTEVGN